MVICLEGCDGSGKSTLAAHLAKQLRAVMIKAERPYKGPDLPAFDEMIFAAQGYGNGLVVLDRHPAISEPIYGNVIRGGHPLLEQDITNSLRTIDVMIYCRPSDEDLYRAIMTLEHMHGVVEHHRKLIEAYDEYAESQDRPFPLIRYDYRGRPPGLLIEQLRRLFRKEMSNEG